MQKKLKILALILILVVALATLGACSSQVPTSISLKDTNYKTSYLLGEELDMTNMILVVTYSDSTTKEVPLDTIKNKITVLGFDTLRSNPALPITITYNRFSINVMLSVSNTTIVGENVQVKYQTDGGSLIAPTVGNKYATIARPTDPTKEGFVFSGWYKENTLTNPWNFVTDKLVSDTTLYAKWAKLYTFVFKDEDGITVIATRYIKAGDSLTDIPAVPEKSGKVGKWNRANYGNITSNAIILAEYSTVKYVVTFFDYNGDKLSTQSVEHGGKVTIPLTPNNNPNHHFIRWDKDLSNITITSNVTVTALYAINQFTVTFDTQQSTIANFYQTVNYNVTATVPSAISMAGYQFDGWYTDNQGLNLWSFGSNTVTRDITLYAHWTKKLTISYYLKDGEIYQKQDVLYGQSIQPLAPPTVLGYTITWDRNNLTNITTDIRIDAIYTVKQFEVKFLNGNELIKSSMVNYGDSAIAPTDIPQRKGHIFTSWSVAFTNITSDLTVSALFDALSYMISFDVAGGSNVESQSIKYDNLITTPACTRDGYQLLGWFISLENDKKWDFAKDTVVGETTLYARWIKEHTITFSGKSQDNDVFKKVLDGETLTDIPVVPHEEGEIGIWDRTEFKDIRGDLTVRAVYTPAKFTVTFVDFNQVVILKIQDVLYNSDVNAPESNPSREGYIFKGWDKPFTNIKADTIIVAQYQVKTYTVIFVDYNYLETLTILLTRNNVEHGQKVAAPPYNPSREGYTFTGWDTDISKTQITSDLTITATYKINVYDVKFVNDDNSLLYLAKVNHGDTATYNGLTPTKIGYSYISWDRLLDNITASITIKALYKINSYTISFDANLEGASAPESISVVYNQLAVEPTEPTFNGYVFLGWYKETSLNNKFLFKTTVISSNLTLYARWEVFTEGTNNVSYALASDGKSYVVNNIASGVDNVIVSNFYNQLPVTAIGNNASINNTDIKTLLLPNTITAIGPNAFAGCKNLSVLNLPKSVTIMGDSAFKDSGLTTVTFSTDSNLTTIGEKVFSGCDKLTDISLPSKLKVISAYAFANASRLKNVVIPKGITNIDSFAFNNCTSLLTLTATAEYPSALNPTAFNNTSEFFKIYVPDASTGAYKRSSSSWNFKASIIYSSNVIHGDWAYEIILSGGNSKIKLLSYLGNESAIEIPVKLDDLEVQELADFALDDSVTSLKIATSLILNANSLTGCRQLQHLELDILDSAFVTSKTILHNIISTHTKLDTLTIPAVLTLRDIFGGQTAPSSLRYINLKSKEGHTSVLANMFSSCTNLFEVSIDKGFTSIANDAFNGAVSLKTINFATDSILSSIETNAFYNCSNLDNLVIPVTVSNIGIDALKGTAWLKNNTENFVIVGDQILYQYKASDSEVTIPNDVKHINDYAFANNSTLTSIIFNNELLSIGQGAFQKNTKLSNNITIPGNVTTLGTDVFSGCLLLKQITFEALSMAITDNMFKDCYSLVKVGYQAITSIGKSAFANCFNLLEFDVGAEVVSIGENAFAGCSKLFKVNIANQSDIITSMATDSFLSCSLGLKIYVPASKLSDYRTASQGYQSKIFGNDVYTEDGFVFDTIDNVMTLIQYNGTQTEIVVPTTIKTQTVDAIADYAFDNRVTIITLNIDTIIGKNILSLATDLEHLKLQNFNKEFKINKESLLNIFKTHDKLTTLTTSGTMTLKSLFYDTVNASSSLPENLKTVYINGESVIKDFQKGALKITSVYIDNAVKMIGESAFDSSVNLKSVKIGEGNLLTRIETKAFNGATLLDEIAISSQVNYIGVGAFNGTKFLNDNNADFVIYGTGILYRVNKDNAEITIPSEVTMIMEQAFNGRGSTKSIIINNDATLITLGSANALLGTSTTLKIYVPTNMISNYVNSWTSYKDKIFANSSI